MSACTYKNAAVELSKNKRNPCCTVTYCPLIFSCAMTVHKFQGFEAEFEETDTVNRIIADISDLAWGNHPGTAYVVASCSKQINTIKSSKDYPKDSSLFSNIIRNLFNLKTNPLFMRQRQGWYCRKRMDVFEYTLISKLQRLN